MEIKTIEEIPKDKLINFEGQKGESFFYQFKTWCLPKEFQEDLQKSVDDMLQKVSDLKDDRLLVLIASLIIENAIDELLKAIIPDYKKVKENKDFTFSMKIELAKALRFIPSWILGCADFIRGLRNNFAHDLHVDSFNQIDTSKIKSMRDRLIKYSPEVPDHSAEIFRKLTFFTFMALYGYRQHVFILNRFIRSEDFPKHLAKFAEDFCKGGIRV